MTKTPDAQNDDIDNAPLTKTLLTGAAPRDQESIYHLHTRKALEGRRFLPPVEGSYQWPTAQMSIDYIINIDHQAEYTVERNGEILPSTFECYRYRIGGIVQLLPKDFPTLFKSHRNCAPNHPNDCRIDINLTRGTIRGNYIESIGESIKTITLHGDELGTFFIETFPHMAGVGIFTLAMEPLFPSDTSIQTIGTLLQDALFKNEEFKRYSTLHQSIQEQIWPKKAFEKYSEDCRR